MDAVVKDHLTVIVIVTLLGIVTGYFALTSILGAVSGMDVALFSGLVFVVPCAIMLVCSFVIAFTANAIGRQLYVVVLAICLVTGIVAMVLSSNWMSDPAVSAALLANSEEGTVIVPILKSPLTILRDIAAFVVVPTVGLIIGAWLGAKFHPMSGEKNRKGKGKKK